MSLYDIDSDHHDHQMPPICLHVTSCDQWYVSQRSEWWEQGNSSEVPRSPQGPRDPTGAARHSGNQTWQR